MGATTIASADKNETTTTSSELLNTKAIESEEVVDEGLTTTSNSNTSSTEMVESEEAVDDRDIGIYDLYEEESISAYAYGDTSSEWDSDVDTEDITEEDETSNQDYNDEIISDEGSEYQNDGMEDIDETLTSTVSSENDVNYENSESKFSYDEN